MVENFYRFLKRKDNNNGFSIGCIDCMEFIRTDEVVKSLF
jgi:hypothetical protein